MADVQVDLERLVRYQASVEDTQKALRRAVAENAEALEDCECQRRSLRDRLASLRERVQREFLDAEYSYRASVTAAERLGQPPKQKPGLAELARLRAAQKKMSDLELCERQLDERCSPISDRATGAFRAASDAMGTYCRFATAGDQALNRYIHLVMKATEDDDPPAVQGAAPVSTGRSSSQHASVPAEIHGASAPGKHPVEKVGTQRYSAIHSTPEGEKHLTVQSGRGAVTVPLNVSALAQQYREAKSEGDTETMKRFQAIYELEWFRESLNLQATDVPAGRQAGYYGDLRNKRPGYHAHHIPAQAVQDRDIDELPAIYLSPAEHRVTDSYGGKMRSVYRSFLPDAPETERYSEEAAAMIADGRYTELVRAEILNLRDQFGTTIDTGISQLLDTIEDMIARQGICGANPECLKKTEVRSQ